MAENAVPRETVRALRDAIARLEKDRPPGLAAKETAGEQAGFRAPGRVADSCDTALPLGVPALDRALAGGLPLKGMTEIRVSQTRDAGAATGFTLALAALFQARRKDRGELAPILWISEAMALREAGAPYAVGLADHGIDLGRALFSRPRSLQEALWIAEAALGFTVFAAVVLEVRGNPAPMGFQESRRLQLRASSGGVPLLFLRQAGEAEATGAAFRLAVRPVPAAPLVLPDGALMAGGIGHPVFHVAAEKSRAFSPIDVFLEWSAHEHRFYPLDPVALPVPADATHPVHRLPASARRPGGAPEMGHVLAFQRAS